MQRFYIYGKRYCFFFQKMAYLLNDHHGCVYMSVLSFKNNKQQQIWVTMQICNSKRKYFLIYYKNKANITINKIKNII